jgi:tetratricopeptide (TPR) repeat protein
VILRVASYILAAALIIGVALYFNRDGPRDSHRLDLSVPEALDCGPHQHDFLGPGCQCDPEAEIKQALADRQDYSSTHADLGKGFYARGRYEVAKLCYLRALELDERNREARYGLALAYSRLGDRANARQELERAIEADRGFVPAYISLAVLDYAEGNYAVARERLEGALRIDSSNTYAKKLLKSLPRIRRYAAARPVSPSS